MHWGILEELIRNRMELTISHKRYKFKQYLVALFPILTALLQGFEYPKQRDCYLSLLRLSWLDVLSEQALLALFHTEKTTARAKPIPVTFDAQHRPLPTILCC